MQARRRNELFNSSSEDSPRHGKRTGAGGGGAASSVRSANKKMNDRKAGKDKPGGVGGNKGFGALKEKNNKRSGFILDCLLGIKITLSVSVFKENSCKTKIMT